MKRLNPSDKNGHVIHVCQKVRIIGIPDLSGMSERSIADSAPSV